jgi:hypothetical protein
MMRPSVSIVLGFEFQLESLVYAYVRSWSYTFQIPTEAKFDWSPTFWNVNTAEVYVYPYY